jgi:hypothetical protein
MVSPDSQAIACPLSGRNSTYRPVQISGTGSVFIASTIACSLVLTARAGVHAAAANVHSATTTAHVHTAATTTASPKGKRVTGGRT